MIDVVHLSDTIKSSSKHPSHHVRISRWRRRFEANLLQQAHVCSALVGFSPLALPVAGIIIATE